MNGKATKGVLGLVVLAVVALGPVRARAWWNAEWRERKAVTVDAAAGDPSGAPVGSVPVLVRLHVGNFAFERAREDGGDVRFVAGDDRTALSHHLERWDAKRGEALVWVGVPGLKAGATTSLWLYYGNPEAAPVGGAGATYDAGTSLVYHFGEDGTAPQDASRFGNHATTAGTAAAGALLGRGLALDGATRVAIPAGAALAWPRGATVTWSAWVKAADSGGTQVIFSRHGPAGAMLVGLDGGKPYVEVTAGGAARRAEAAAPLGGDWHQLSVVAAEGVALHVDGARAAAVEGGMPGLDGPSILGGDGPGEPGAGFRGELDELRISREARSEAFLRLTAALEGTEPGKVLTVGAEEQGESGGYLAVILGTVTVDGWVVIAILAVMALVSWMVMIDKAVSLGRAERADRHFQERYRRISAELAVVVEGGKGELMEDRLVKDSPLRRLLEVGLEELRKRTRGEAGPLAPEAIAAVKAALDAAQVREGQRSTRFMVFLTLAISGGPFLGLLGTVVGVMITFAAIAAAGDVNVNAIAPGIAAALAATVAGLAVAIPALFGYNWLLSRTKNQSATMHAFVDELVTNAAEAYARRRSVVTVAAAQASGA